MLPKGELVDVVDKSEDEQWVCIDYQGKDGYVSAEFLELNFILDCGETNEEIKEGKSPSQTLPTRQCR